MQNVNNIIVFGASLSRRCEEVLKTVSCDKCERKNSPDDICEHCLMKICNDTIAAIEAYEKEVSRLQKEKDKMCVNCTWKKQAMDVNKIPNALGGACFHGEVWVRCPKCQKGIELHGQKPFMKEGEYTVYQCECGQLFKD